MTTYDSDENRRMEWGYGLGCYDGTASWCRVGRNVDAMGWLVVNGRFTRPRTGSSQKCEGRKVDKLPCMVQARVRPFPSQGTGGP